MVQRPHVVRFHTLVRLTMLFLFYLSIHGFTLTLVSPLEFQGLGLAALRLALLLFVAAVGTVTVFTFRFQQVWDYNGVTYRRWVRRRRLERDCVDRVVVHRSTLESKFFHLEFDRFHLEGACDGPRHSLGFDFLMSGAVEAKKTLNQWALLRPAILQGRSLHDFILRAEPALPSKPKG